MILVTGGAGYIGCVAVRQLLDRGHAVRVFDKLYFGDEGLDEVRDKVEIVQGDIRSFDGAVLDGCDAVVHLAGLSNDPTAEFNPRANHDINAIGTERIAEACKQHGVERFVFASTCSIYDRGLAAPDELRDEDSEVYPRAAYAVSNYEAETTLRRLADASFCPVILRQGTVYGWSPRMRYDLVVNTFVRDAVVGGHLRVHAGGAMWRPLVDVADVSRAYVACVEAPADRVRGQVFNLVQDNYRILELAHRVQEALKPLGRIEIDVDYSDVPVRSYRVSGERIAQALGFRPRIGVEAAVGTILTQVRELDHRHYFHPRHYNIEWMTLLVELESSLRRMGGVF